MLILVEHKNSFITSGPDLFYFELLHSLSIFKRLNVQMYNCSFLFCFRNMKTAIILALCCLAMAQAFPGGYGYGYKPKKHFPMIKPVVPVPVIPMAKVVHVPVKPVIPVRPVVPVIHKPVIPVIPKPVIPVIPKPVMPVFHKPISKCTVIMCMRLVV